MRKFLNKFWIVNNCKGQIAGSGFVLMLIGLLTGVGLILDTGKLFETRMTVQTSVDASLIACGEYFYRKNKSLPSSEVISCLRKNFEFNLLENGLDATNCKEGDPTSPVPLKNRYVYTVGSTSTPGYMEINCSMKHETVLLGLLPGVNIANITSGSSSTGQYAVGGNIPVGLVLTMDLSDSVDQTELDKILAAAVKALDIMPDGSKLAINTFNGGYNGNWGQFNRKLWLKNVLGWNNGEVWLTLNSSTRAMAQERIQRINTKYWSSNGTYGQGGLYMARMLLDRLESSGSNIGRGIIFLSDGEMTKSATDYNDYSYPPIGGSACADNDTACRAPHYTNQLDPGEVPNPNNDTSSWPVVEWGNVYPNKNKPKEPDTWYKRNLYTQYNEKEINDNSLTTPVIQNWPVNETFLPGLTLNYLPECSGPRSGNALAAREADLARSAGISVFALCVPCASTLSPNIKVMQRISADKYLPSDWLSQIGYGTSGNWRLPEDFTAKCQGYGYSNGNASYFNYTRDIVEADNERFYRHASGGSATQAEYTDMFEDMIWKIQKGNLSK